MYYCDVGRWRPVAAIFHGTSSLEVYRPSLTQLDRFQRHVQHLESLQFQKVQSVKTTSRLSTAYIRSAIPGPLYSEIDT